MTLTEFHRAALNIGPDYHGEHAAIFGARCAECALGPRCVECGRVFDLRDATDAEEWAYGHDCEAQR